MRIDNSFSLRINPPLLRPINLQTEDLASIRSVRIGCSAPLSRALWFQLKRQQGSEGRFSKDLQFLRFLQHIYTHTPTHHPRAHGVSHSMNSGSWACDWATFGQPSLLAMPQRPGNDAGGATPTPEISHALHHMTSRCLHSWSGILCLSLITTDDKSLLSWLVSREGRLLVICMGAITSDNSHSMGW